jgi:ribonuclease R
MKHKKDNSREEKTSGTFTGIYCQRRGAGWVEPDGSSHTDITIHRGQELGAKNGDRVEFEITGRRHKKGSYEGRILSIFDAESTFLAEQVLLPEKHLLRNQFPPRNNAELKVLTARETSVGYRDLRDVLCITIDPVDAKDFDDAVSIEKAGDTYRLGVYIADVTHYVPENSLIDKEAFLRGTSTYFPWGVIPMLPPALSEDLCSLKPGEDRRAAACVMTVNKSGKVLQADIFRCFIINKRRLNYQEAQGILDGKVQEIGRASCRERG